MKSCAILCIVGSAAFVGCKESQNSSILLEEVDSIQSGDASGEEYSSWVESFESKMKESGARNATGVAAVGTTGAVPAFNFGAAATTGDAPASFNFGAAATTGDAPAFFNFGAAAATTGDAPASFNFSASAATTGDAPLAFHFNSAAGAKNGDAPVAKLNFGAANVSRASAAPHFDFGEFAKQRAEADKALVAAEAAVKEAEANLAGLERTAKTVANDFAAKKATLDKWFNDYASATAQTAKAKVAVENAQKAIASAEENLTSKQAVSEGKTKVQSDLLSKRDEAKNVADSAEQALKVAEADREKAKAAADEAASRAEKAKSAVAASLESVARAKQDLANKLGEESGVKDSVVALTSKLNDAKSAAAEAQSAIEGKEGEEKDEAERIVREASDAVGAAEKALADASNLLQTVSVEVKKLTDFLSTAEASANSASESAKAAESASANAARSWATSEEKLSAAKDQKDKAVVALNTAEQALKNSEVDLEKANADRARAQSSLETAKVALTEASSSLGVAEKAETEVKKDLDAAQGEFDRVNSALKDANDKRDAGKAVLQKALGILKAAQERKSSLAQDDRDDRFFFSSLNEAYSAEFEPQVPSAENLESATDSLVSSLEKDVQDLEMIPDFEDGIVSIRRDANSLSVVALVLGASDVQSSRKASAKPLILAAQQLANASSVDEAKTAIKAVLAAKDVVGSKSGVQWGKVAQLSPLMKNALPLLATEIKRLSRNEKTLMRSTNANKVIDHSTLIVAIALGARKNVDETLSPKDDTLWQEYCANLANVALEFNLEANKLKAGEGNFNRLKEYFKKVEATCSSTCHEKFGGYSAE